MSGVSSLPSLLQSRAKRAPGVKSSFQKKKKKTNKQKTPKDKQTKNGETVPKHESAPITSPSMHAKRKRDENQNNDEDDTQKEKSPRRNTGAIAVSPKSDETGNDKKLRKAPPRKRRGVLPRQMKDNRDLSCVVASPLGAVQTLVISTKLKDLLLQRLTSDILSKFDYSLSPRWLSSLSTNRKAKPGDEKDLSSSDKKRNESSVAESATTTKTMMLNQLLRAVIQSRLVCGVNQCTRLLERCISAPDGTSMSIARAALANSGEGASAAVTATPRMIWLARDVRPPHILAHIPTMAKLVPDEVPLILLPGQASVDLGNCLGGKLVAVVAFLPASQEEPPEAATLFSDDKEEGKAMMVRFHKAMDSFIAYCLSMTQTATARDHTMDEHDD